MASSAPSAPYASASLYVGDLARDVTEAMLYDIFNAVGPVASVRICRDAATRRSLGYAYVNFHRMEDAERALDTMNYKLIRGTACRIMWSHRDPSLRKSGVGNVFVKNLAKSIDNKTLFDTFSIFGNILSCKVATNERLESLGYGFVHYASEENAQDAIARVNGKVIAGQQVTVAAFKPKKEHGGDPTKFTNLYVKNLPSNISESKFKNMFAEFGTTTSTALARDKDGGFRGFGFVAFSKNEEAKAAMDALNGKSIDDQKLVVVPFQKKKDRERELRAAWEQRKADRQKKYPGVNLYVKNLADSVDDARLLSIFSKFGQITSAKVMLDDHGKSKGFGFVCFANPEEATKAVTEMNSAMIEGKPLYIALAQRKEVRRAQLEAQFAARMGSFPGHPMYHGPQGAPIFYPGMPQRPMIYPQGMQMVPGRWNPGAQGAPGHMISMTGPQGMNYSLVPSQPRGGGAQRGRGRGRGGGAGQMRQGQLQQGPSGPTYDQRRVPGGDVASVRYTPNVRNPPIVSQAQGGVPVQSQPRAVPARQAQGVQAPKPAPAPVPAPAPAVVQAPVPGPLPQPQPLTIQQLAAAPESTKKQMIGERLFPLVQVQQPKLAGKITGMLLEMDNGELIHLLESRTALSEKIMEAVTVLKRAEHQQQEEEEGDEEEDEEEDAA